MEDNNKNTSTEGTQTSTDGTQGSEKTFTQDDVNRIVQERLAKERGKGTGNSEDDLTKRAAELDQRERKLNAVDTLRKEGLPDYLVDALNMNTEEDFQKSLEAIKKMKGETTEPKMIGRIASIPGMVNTSGNGTQDETRKAFGLK